VFNKLTYLLILSYFYFDKDEYHENPQTIHRRHCLL